jgi:hypothetical protein
MHKNYKKTYICRRVRLNDDIRRINKHHLLKIALLRYGGGGFGNNLGGLVPIIF